MDTDLSQVETLTIVYNKEHEALINKMITKLNNLELWTVVLDEKDEATTDK